MSITIYDAQGNRIHTLSLGTKPAGMYLAREKAAYWDGRSESGESIASGMYFCHFQAGEPLDEREGLTHFAATKKMLILK